MIVSLTHEAADLIDAPKNASPSDNSKTLVNMRGREVGRYFEAALDGETLSETIVRLHKEKPMTTEQRDKLLAAIEAARGPGACQYVYNDAPRCVIAQLAHFEGVTIDEMRKWEGSDICGVFGLNYPGSEKLNEYHPTILHRIQRKWDLAKDWIGDDAQEDLREEMREIVRESVIV